MQRPIHTRGDERQRRVEGKAGNSSTESSPHRDCRGLPSHTRCRHLDGPIVAACSDERRASRALDIHRSYRASLTRTRCPHRRSICYIPILKGLLISCHKKLARGPEGNTPHAQARFKPAHLQRSPSRAVKQRNSIGGAQSDPAFLRIEAGIEGRCKVGGSAAPKTIQGRRTGLNAVRTA